MNYYDLPKFKVRLIHSITENEIPILIKNVLSKWDSNRELIEFTRGFCTKFPKREIKFEEKELITKLNIYHTEIHFDSEKEGQDIALLISLINNEIIKLKNLPIIQNNYITLYVLTMYQPLDEKYLNEINIANKLYKENIQFTKPVNGFIYYIKFKINNYIFINDYEEKYINKILGEIYYTQNIIREKELIYNEPNY
jgi:hypothetical protein